MDKSRYLQRIKFSAKADTDDKTLMALHRHHVMNIPFENMDIHCHKLFDLEPENIYQKVVENCRGGFCYELNYLFNSLLNEIGFSSRIISSRIYDSDGVLGPEFDHMSIHVKTEKEYLADVGFGDLFLQPLVITDGVQNDGRNYFIIEKDGADDYTLSMSSDGSDFQKKYRFNLMEVPLESFKGPCIDKQTNPESFFVKNIVCTIATETGRITIFNDRIIRNNGKERVEGRILGDNDLRIQLRRSFNIEIGGENF